MASTSKYGHYVTPYGTLSADAPMSVATARAYLNNARHLIDQSTQTRVNWQAWLEPASLVGEGVMRVVGLFWAAGNAEYMPVKSYYFPISMIGKNADNNSYKQPVNLVVSLHGYTHSATELFFRVVLQPQSIPISAIDLHNDRCLAHWTDSTISNSSELIIDGTTVSQYPSNVLARMRPTAYQTLEHDGNVYSVLMFMARLTIYAMGGLDGNRGHITGVYVRECQL